MKDQKGFTLVELAIALVVIGLLLAGVLKGQEMIENGKITATVRQLENMQSAVAMFDSAYDALPGDIKDPATRIPDCATALCNVTGNGNRRVNYVSGSATDAVEEQYNFFPHMTKAGFLKYPEGGTAAPGSNDEDAWTKFVPVLPLNDMLITVYYRNAVKTWNGERPNPPGHYFDTQVLSGNNKMITGKQMYAIDEKIDDGKPQTGWVQGGRCAEGDWSSNVYDPAGECTLEMRGRF